MTSKSSISIVAFVSEEERAAVQLATAHLERALSQSATVPWTCNCRFAPDFETLRQSSDATLLLTSLLPELAKIGEPWPQVEERLRTAYATLSQGGAPVFICTILRHITLEEGLESPPDLIVRIRRLNLLATEISRQTGVYIIDLDRALANIGASRLKTDYRLRGNAAIEMAGHFMALTLINNAFDALVSFEVLEAAAAAITSWRPSVAATDDAKPEVTFQKHLLSMVQGRRKVFVSAVAGTVEESHADWLIRQMMRGKIRPTDAFRRLIQSVRRHGIRESTHRLISGLSRQFHFKK